MTDTKKLREAAESEHGKYGFSAATVLSLLDELDAARGAVEIIATEAEKFIGDYPGCRSLKRALSHPTVQAARAK
jgi:hypothetical protein